MDSKKIIVKLPKLPDEQLKLCKTYKESDNWYMNRDNRDSISRILDNWNDSIIKANKFDTKGTILWYYNVTGLYVFVNTNNLEGKTAEEVLTLVKLLTTENDEQIELN